MGGLMSVRGGGGGLMLINLPHLSTLRSQAAFESPLLRGLVGGLVRGLTHRSLPSLPLPRRLSQLLRRHARRGEGGLVNRTATSSELEHEIGGGEGAFGHVRKEREGRVGLK